VTDFDGAFRGYDRMQVDALVKQIEAARGRADEGARDAARAALKRRLRRGFSIVLRGYRRPQVDAYFAQVLEELAAR
jgi:cell division septum initiation protein DivIVA